MTAFYGSVALKERCIAQLQEHYRLDQITQGTYGVGKSTQPDFQGCHLSCLGHPQPGEDVHEKVTRLWGFPQRLTYLIETIFEALPRAKARAFPLQQVQDTPVGADLSLIVPRFALWMLTDPRYGALPGGASKHAEMFVTLCQRMLDGSAPTMREWATARETFWQALKSSEARTSMSVPRRENLRLEIAFLPFHNPMNMLVHDLTAIFCLHGYVSLSFPDPLAARDAFLALLRDAPVSAWEATALDGARASALVTPW